MQEAYNGTCSRRYLTGLGLSFVLETIIAVLLIPFPPYLYPEFDIDKIAIATVLR